MIIHKTENELKEKELMQAYYEHQIKEFYRDFIQNVLRQMTHDDMEFHKKFALTTLEVLLEGKPELEETILNIIINKLGD